MESSTTHLMIFEKVLKENLKNPVSSVTNEVKKYLDGLGCIVEEEKVSSFVYRFFERWKISHQSTATFLTKNKQWLGKKFCDLPIQQTEGKRTSKDFMSLSECSKRRRTSDIREELEATGSDEMLFVAKSKLHSEKKNKAARLVGEMQKSPGRASKILEAYKNPTSGGDKFTPEEALALLMELKLSKGEYKKMMKKINKKCKKKILPTYNKVREAKQDCYVLGPGCKITESEAVLDLETALSVTAIRLLKTLPESTFISEEKLTLVFKWGFDGSSGHVTYKQGFQGKAFDDSTIFTTSIVPLILFDKEKKKQIWKNPMANSSSLCRPIRISFEKETKENVEAESKRMNEAIKKLQPFHAVFGESITEICFEMILSMLDAKAINILEENLATTVCYLCKCLPSRMNDADMKNFQNFDPHILEYGISPLHAWINCFEFFLHLAYRLRLPEEKQKKYARLTDQDKITLNQTKENIQTQFRTEMGLIVDVPKAGFGNSNDGNSARRFFKDPEKTSKITGLDKELLIRFRNILMAINSSEEIDHEKFRKYAEDTYQRYISIYKFYQMSPTLHKILCHGADMIQHCILPVGILGEECQEGSHKFFKMFRDQHARKDSRSNTMRDVINRFLVFSDPFLRSLMEPEKRKKAELPEEVKSMKKEEFARKDEECSENDEEDEDSDYEEDGEDEDDSKEERDSANEDESEYEDCVENF